MAKDTKDTTQAAAPAATTGGRGTIPGKLLELVERPKTDERGRVITEEVRRRRKGETTIERVPVVRPVERKEVLRWREYPDRVVVVTTDGHKYAGAK